MNDPDLPGSPQQPPVPGQPQQPPAYGQPQPPPYGQPEHQQPPAPHYSAAPQGRPAPNEERFWASCSHWGALAVGVFSSGFLAWLVPMIVMMVKGNESPFVRREAVESLNFQISMLIYAAISAVLLLVLVGFILLPVVAVWWLVGTILGAVKANNGEENRFALIFRFVS